MYKKIGPGLYEIQQKEGMLVPGLLVANEAVLQQALVDKALTQVENVAHLPGIIGHSIAMPDIHWGYGFPIGGVAATDAETGVVSPGGVGYDINCGVRLAFVPIEYNQLSEKTLQALLTSIFTKVPSGVGKQGGRHITPEDYEAIARRGVGWALDKGFALPEDIEHIESRGCLEEAACSAVSDAAFARGSKQLGTIGSGNHFLEIGEVGHIFQKPLAKKWGVEQSGLYILIHSGSRGFGHQICQDTLSRFMREGYAEGLPDKQLVCAPISSDAGQTYLRAMACAANFAFCNRQTIFHSVRESFQEVLGIEPRDVRLLYDVCHNIAKFETHHNKRVLVHRKGATRSFGPHHPELADIFQSSGQPVIVPGDMARASYLLAGKGNPITFSSCCHGAGRSKSRRESKAAFHDRSVASIMEEKKIVIMASSPNTVFEEMPEAYKDVDIVISAVTEAGLADRVARLTPKMVIKG